MNVYKVNFGYNVKGNPRLRNASLIVRAPDVAGAKAEAIALVDAMGYDWFRLTAIVEQSSDSAQAHLIT